MFKSVFKRMNLALGLVAAATIVFNSPLAQAQSWPDKPVKLVIPFAAGGTTDILGRLLAQQLSTEWKQNVIVENKGGAGGNIAADLVAKSPADGYTIMLASGSMLTVNPYLYKKLPLDYDKDFKVITNVASGPMVLSVNPKVPVKNVKELIALAKTKDLNFGSAGIGSQVHMAGENFTFAAGINATHVPYKGESAALNDLVAGQIDFMVGNLTAAAGFAKSGQIRALGVTSAKRVAQLPDVPTVAESIPGFENTGWFGLVVPSGTPNAVVDRIYRSTLEAFKNPEFRTRVEGAGLSPVLNSPEEFAAQIKKEGANWEKIVKARNLSQ
jgi:tripartite-type tricarboxylate transporter receptor subunit TctC